MDETASNQEDSAGATKEIYIELQNASLVSLILARVTLTAGEWDPNAPPGLPE